MHAEGSSPLTRGKPFLMVGQFNIAGLIPAHAGKTERRRRGDHRPRAHPRSRGENGLVVAWAVVRHGSSPLTRGKPHPRAYPRLPRGLIPAHAGKTGSKTLTRAPRRAHPRSRGENGRSSRRPFPPWGSSPLTRGKQEFQLGLQERGRLIPAHAGKTYLQRLQRSDEGAHPRSRGENTS